MKANELMIGDWVFCTYPSINKPVKVAEIKTVVDSKLKIVICDDDVRLVFYETYIDPIPLAPDMLLTNGFELQEMGGGRVDIWTGFGEDNCHDIEVEFDGDKPIHLKIDGPVYLATPNIKYLHQLQHFLRDCETGKEIEL